MAIDSRYAATEAGELLLWGYCRANFDLIRDDSSGAWMMVPDEVFFTAKDAKRAANLEHLREFVEIMFDCTDPDEWYDYEPLHWEPLEYNGGYSATENDYDEWLIYPLNVVADTSIPAPEECYGSDPEVG